MKTHFGKIYLPHLNYTVEVKLFKTPPESLENALAYVQSNGQHSCSLYIGKTYKPADLAHELIHVLQFIALARNIDFKLEQEHFGYLMHYLMIKIEGGKWD